MTRRKRRQLHELPLRVSCAALVEEGKRREPSKAELWELDQLEQAVSWAKGGLHEIKQALKWGGGVDFVLIRERRKQLATAEQRFNERKAGWGLPQEGSGHG